MINLRGFKKLSKRTRQVQLRKLALIDEFEKSNYWFDDSKHVGSGAYFGQSSFWSDGTKYDKDLFKLSPQNRIILHDYLLNTYAVELNIYIDNKFSCDEEREYFDEIISYHLITK